MYERDKSDLNYTNSFLLDYQVLDIIIILFNHKDLSIFFFNAWTATSLNRIIY